MTEDQIDQSTDDTERCAACGEIVYKSKNEVNVRFMERSPDGHEAAVVVLCELCREGIYETLDRTLNTDTEQGGSDR